MTDPTNAGYPVDRAQGMPDGWVLFSGMLILFTGVWNAFEGVFGFFRSTWFIGHAIGGSLWIWAALLVAFGIVQILAGAAVMSHRTWGRWFGIVTLSVVTLVYLLNIGFYPFWSFVIIAINLTALFGLTVHWNRSRENAY